MGKKKVVSEVDMQNMILPATTDVLGVAVKMLGFDRVMVKCQDGHERLCRIRGKIKRRVWIREGDIVLVSPWDFQSEIKRESSGGTLGRRRICFGKRAILRSKFL